MQKFKNSLRNAITVSRESIKRDGIGKYYLLFMMNLIFSYSIFLSPFNVSMYEAANEMKKGNRITLTTLFDSASDKRFSKQLQANIVKFIMFLSVFIILAFLGFILYLIGASIGEFSSDREYIYLWVIPAYAVMFIYVLIIPYIHVPNAYISNTYPSLSISRILKFSFYAYKNGGKKRMLLINIFDYGIKLLILLPFVIVGLILYNNMSGSKGLGFLFLFLGIGLLLFIIAYPFITLPTLLMKKDLFDEIVFVKASNKYNANFDFDIDINSNQNTLNNMFDIESKKEEGFSSLADKFEELDRKHKKEEKRKRLEKELDSKNDLKEDIVESNEVEIEEEKLEEKDNEELEETINESNEVTEEADSNESILEDGKDELEAASVKENDEIIEASESEESIEAEPASDEAMDNTEAEPASDETEETNEEIQEEKNEDPEDKELEEYLSTIKEKENSKEE